ncbi:MAG: hypothetical protein RIQ93_2399 [Verrucomicrobiota bacterium]|jgi:CheY-like chemotaxis protein
MLPLDPNLWTEIPSILIVDDNPDAHELMRHALKKARIKASVVIAPGGNEAKDYLRRCCPTAGGAPRLKPEIVFLDVNMPEVSGFDVLKWIRQTPGLENIRVIMVSSSQLESDVKHATELGADGYIIKFPSPAELGERLRSLAVE